ncbi:extracellular tyrosine-protein kinase PKDCC-like isoform X1 [Mercenaria mercenaria]|uniref:extracellular tyrosine-protein kinase PKDCC-like isoform X1 n=1 Tax=Mercenaria mercenaria TaxID=6596 RepID=UPI00234FB209|nr:extracellular tyrosine-protein kinase PKDCC-like isoform X1 [Mercenaria mercenaria]XP_045185771.2 extracellular tyrosine-protein kinase PKDCC-like isoform X1 [Mercenaria mercenaria]XP_053398214.1 extracellular tyrosine-protein kinase PKDCC-like isoform X1 [Mercenaria mercenaria]XP_053398218.1 extracellular tyrosine-protein kinase PKDCC-like isoform X1 [Mercenaria mercenaria]XP_053398226.1 extracellular tyrosine-protein kinase PKDCC-like isoform X1 [Mercenaria mercenaria]
MFWKFKRRYRKVISKQGLYYISVVISFLLFMNIMTFQRNFADLEGENNVDPGGTSSEYDLGNIELRYNVFHERKLNSRESQRYLFQNKVRKLLNIMESSLENSVIYSAPEKEVLFERYFPDHLMYCDDIANITDRTYIASGWTKAVYKGTYKGSPVALKTVDVKGQDVTTCMDSGMSETACFVKAAKKIVKEIVLLQALAGENVLKVLGFCLPRNVGDILWVAMVTELGESVDLIKLLQMSLEDRLRVCLDITRIVNFMSQTPYGSMSMNDFRLQQFVLVDGNLKLSDVDDTGFEDPACRTSDDCNVIFSSANFSKRTNCRHGRCVKYNEMKNLFNAGRHFVIFLLPHGAPVRLQPIIDGIVEGYANLTMSSEELMKQMNKLVALYQSGWYLNRTKSNSSYKKMEQSDLPGQYDYRCRLSFSMATCTVSVFDLLEAEEFVITTRSVRALL